MAAPAGVSAETLQKVRQMKARVENTISNRLQDVNQRRMRQIELEQRMNELGLTENERREFRQTYMEQERNHLRDQRTRLQLSDFATVSIIGKGAFGEVRIVRAIRDGTVYAMKSMRKRDMIAKNQATHIQAERDLMVAAESELLVKLFFSFQDNTYLYLVMEFCGGGDLMTVLMREDILSEEQARFYMGELAAAINAVHELDFVHRDLKPDNILIANNGHVKLSDFGLAKSFNTENDHLVSKFQKKSNTLRDTDVNADNAAQSQYRQDKATPTRKAREKMFSTVGTPDYIAPEVFSQRGYDKMVDWWSMGVIMFECLVGYPPFYAEDPLQTCRKIVHYRKYFKIPSDANLSRPALDLIHKLVCSYRRRIGFEGIAAHPWFRSIPWEDLESMPPPFEPNLTSDVDASNFDTIEADQDVENAQVVASKVTDDTHFWNFTFKSPVDMNAPDIQAMFAQYQNEALYEDENGENTNQPQQTQPQDQ